MDGRVQLQLVVNDGEGCGFATHAQYAFLLPGKADFDAPFELSGIDRVCELHIEYTHLRAGIDGILIELGGGDARRETRRRASQVVSLETDLRGENTLVERNLVNLGDRPVFFGTKLQNAAIQPAPRAPQPLLHGHAGL